ncbi:MAG: ester cyclase [Frankiales bacterium]|nr:ester cyclase [Frankiales bacterium]
MSDILTLAVTYSEAWSQHDPQAIAALHTEDSVFHVHDILDPFVGRPAIAEAAAGFFKDSPDLAFERGRVHLGEDHVVSEYVMSGTLLGRSFACEGTDIFSVRDGLVARKDSYIDWLTYQAQTGTDMTHQGVRLLPVLDPLVT